MVCFCWDGLPQYAARCIGKYVMEARDEVVVVATRPEVPVRGMEQLCGCKVIWIERNDTRSICSLVGRMPEKLIVTGWAIPAFNRFRDEARAVGGKVFAMNDENYQGSFKQFLKALRFRLLLHRKYDGFFVPGRSAQRLMRYYGVDRGSVACGMYSADASLFFNGQPLAQREKRMLFVGQFCERKNVLRICEAFLKIELEVRNGWILELCGCGPQKKELPKDDSILIHDFVQPEELAELYRNARIFVLGSKEEHWGLVVHEAALSGCVLALSNRIGAAEDFLAEGVNGYLFNPESTVEVRKVLMRTMQLTDDELSIAQASSLALAGEISLSSFVAGVETLLGER